MATTCDSRHLPHLEGHSSQGNTAHFSCSNNCTADIKLIYTQLGCPYISLMEQSCPSTKLLPLVRKKKKIWTLKLFTETKGFYPFSSGSFEPPPLLSAARPSSPPSTSYFAYCLWAGLPLIQ